MRPSSYVENDTMEGVQRELRTELPGQHLKVSSEGGLIFLRGTVKDLNSSQRAFQIASTAGKVVNLLYVDVPPAQPQILLKVRFASVDLTRRETARPEHFQCWRGQYYWHCHHWTISGAHGFRSDNCTRSRDDYERVEHRALSPGSRSGRNHPGSAE